MLEKKDINEKVMKMEIFTFITVCKKLSANNFFSVSIFVFLTHVESSSNLRFCYIYTENIFRFFFVSF